MKIEAHEIQWLLIGGPFHGQVIKEPPGKPARSQLRMPHSDGEDYLYIAQRFLRAPDEYRFGVCYSEGGGDVDDYVVGALIDSTGLCPMVPTHGTGIPLTRRK